MEAFSNVESLDRFEKVVKTLGLYVTENDKALCKAMREDDCDYLEQRIQAFASEECFTEDRGFLLCLFRGDLYMCYETKYIDEKFYCNGSMPAFITPACDIISHLANLMKDYKLEINRQRKLEILKNFMDAEEKDGK